MSPAGTRWKNLVELEMWVLLQGQAAISPAQRLSVCSGHEVEAGRCPVISLCSWGQPNVWVLSSAIGQMSASFWGQVSR